MNALLLERQLPGAPAAVTEVRTAMDGWLDEVDVDLDRGRDVITVASELVALNVAQGPPSCIALTVWSFPNDIYLEVVTVDQRPSDAGRGDVEDPDRGIRAFDLVRRLADGMAVKESGPESAVCCWFHLPRPSPAAQ